MQQMLSAEERGLELEYHSNRYMANYRNRYMAHYRNRYMARYSNRQTTGRARRSGKRVKRSEHGAWAMAGRMRMSVAGEELFDQLLWCAVPEVLLLGAAHLQPAHVAAVSKVSSRAAEPAQDILGSPCCHVPCIC